MALLEIENLSVELLTNKGWIAICKALDLVINEGEICGMIGSTGSGKSLIAKAIMGMHANDLRVHADRFKINDVEISHLSLHERRKIIGQNIAMIFQEARSSLDPSKTIEEQMCVALPDSACPSKAWYKRFFWRKQVANNLLHKVWIKDTQKILKSYPYQLSEVLCQKVIIAIALGRKPKLLIADDPISAMTSISQLQILRLISSFNQNNKGTVLYITNDLGPCANLMDKINILYSGQIVESGSTEQILNRPRHPFTESILYTIPDFNHNIKRKTYLKVLKGDAPEFYNMPIGCPLGTRCPYADRECNITPPLTKMKNGYYRCHFPRNTETDNV